MTSKSVIISSFTVRFDFPARIRFSFTMSMAPAMGALVNTLIKSEEDKIEASEISILPTF